MHRVLPVLPVLLLLAACPGPADKEPAAKPKFSVGIEHEASLSRTDRYVIPGAVVVRRGSEFKVRVRFTIYEMPAQARHSFKLAGTGTSVTFGDATWTGDEKALTHTATFKIPDDAPIGRYTAEDTVTVDGVTLQVEGAMPEVIVLFNPESKLVATRVPPYEVVDRAADLEDDVITIWNGDTAVQFHTDQYSPAVTSACLDMLMRLSPTDRADEVAVTEAITTGVTALLGDCHNDADPKGGEPWVWSSSTDILKAKAQPKYGQCWVFAGVTSSLLRSIGIPSRVDTNFNSARETATPPKDRCKGAVVCNGEPAMSWSFATWAAGWARGEGDKPSESRSDNSIWNFHVWNTAMISRPDLKAAGWNAFDGTCQEESEGKCGGPRGLTAIGDAVKKGLAGSTTGDAAADAFAKRFLRPTKLDLGDGKSIPIRYFDAVRVVGGADEKGQPIDLTTGVLETDGRDWPVDFKIEVAGAVGSGKGLDVTLPKSDTYPVKAARLVALAQDGLAVAAPRDCAPNENGLGCRWPDEEVPVSATSLELQVYVASQAPFAARQKFKILPVAMIIVRSDQKPGAAEYTASAKLPAHLLKEKFTLETELDGTRLSTPMKVDGGKAVTETAFKASCTGGTNIKTAVLTIWQADRPIAVGESQFKVDAADCVSK